ncbi:MAG: hypothetical protein U9P14_08005 [Gemmatimonadota bacterium]|nr:hypothetical protein [Gemmatimonadota bacterium]
MDSKDSESRQEDSGGQVPENADNGNGVSKSGGKSPEEIVSQRIIYEDDLRRACLKREPDIAEQHVWMAFRKRIPISQWVERTFDSSMGQTEKHRFLQELKDYRRVFAREAEERGLKLDMECNYYSQAVELFGKYRGPELITEEDREMLTGLMIMVDFKDAKLGIQILKSIT